MRSNSRTGPRRWVAVVLLLAGAFGAFRLVEGIVCQGVEMAGGSMVVTVGAAVPGGGGAVHMEAANPATSAADPAPASSPVPCGAAALAASLATLPLLWPGRWTPVPRRGRDRLAIRSTPPLDRPPRHG